MSRREKLIRALAEIKERERRLEEGAKRARERARQQLDSMPEALEACSRGLTRTANPLVGRRQRVLVDEQQRLLRMTREPDE